MFEILIAAQHRLLFHSLAQNSRFSKTQKMSKLKIFLSVQLIRQFTCDLTTISIQCKTIFCWTKFFGQRKYLSKTFFRFFGISTPSGSGKPDASYLGGSLGQEDPKDTSSMRIGPAVPPTLPLITPILIRLPYQGQQCYCYWTGSENQQEGIVSKAHYHITS